MKESLEGAQLIGTLITELGDEWRCYLQAGTLFVDGSDIDWQQRNAENHRLSLDSRAAMWLAACVAIGRMLPRYKAGASAS